MADRDRTKVILLGVTAALLGALGLASAGIGALWIWGSLNPEPGEGSLAHVGLGAIGFGFALVGVLLEGLGLWAGLRARTLHRRPGPSASGSAF
jgi:hypothetical protein